MMESRKIVGENGKKKKTFVLDFWKCYNLAVSTISAASIEETVIIVAVDIGNGNSGEGERGGGGGGGDEERIC